MHTRLAKLLSFLCFVFLSCPAFSQAPAEQTELAKNGVSIKTDIYTPSKGLVSNLSDYARDKNAAKVLDNLQMLKPGIWTSRGIGWVRHSPTPISGTNPIIESLGYESGDGQFHYFFQCGNKFYEYDIATHTAIDITSSMSLNATVIPDLSPIQSSSFLLCNGTEQPYYWTGSTMATLPGGFNATIGGVTFSNPQMSAAYYGRQIYAGCSTSGVYQGYIIVLSQQGNPGGFTASSPPLATDGGNITLPTTECGRITGLYPWKLPSGDNVLLIGCQHGLFMLTGTDATNFGIKLLTKEFGVVNNRCWVPLGNDLYFLATDGIRSLSNSLSGTALIPSNASYPVQDLFNRMSKNALDKPFACHIPFTQEVQFWFPIDGETICRHAVVLKYLGSSNDASAVTSFNPIFSTKSGTTVNCMSNVNGIVLGGGNDGIVQQHYVGSNFGGSPMLFQYLSPLIGSNSPSQSASVRKFEILLEGSNQKFVAEAYSQSPLSTNQSQWLFQGGNYVTSFPPSVIDLSTWADTYQTTTIYPQSAPLETKGNGRYWMLRLYGNATILTPRSGQSNSDPNRVILTAAAGDTDDLAGTTVLISSTGESRTVVSNTYSGGKVTLVLDSPTGTAISTSDTIEVTSNDTIDLVGFQPILNVGGWRQ